MVELADHRNDELTRQVIDDASRLREVMRTVRPETARMTASTGPGKAGGDSN
jgi:hypothetical protein